MLSINGIANAVAKAFGYKIVRYNKEWGRHKAHVVSAAATKKVKVNLADKVEKFSKKPEKKSVAVETKATAVVINKKPPITFTPDLFDTPVVSGHRVYRNTGVVKASSGILVMPNKREFFMNHYMIDRSIAKKIGLDVGGYVTVTHKGEFVQIKRVDRKIYGETSRPYVSSTVLGRPLASNSAVLIIRRAAKYGDRIAPKEPSSVGTFSVTDDSIIFSAKGWDISC